jgi:hypothetical protein
MTYRRYRVSPSDKRPLLDFVVRALETSRCTVLEVSDLNEAPYRITFESPTGERIGIIVYVFLANNKQIKNRPPDEHRFQIKYGSDFASMHEIWQDPYRLYTTLLLGVNPEAGFFVGADPSLNNPTRFSVSKEFKDHQATEITKRGWYAWERGRQGNELEPVEVLIGGLPEHFYRYVLFEREARGEDQGTRHYLADEFGQVDLQSEPSEGVSRLPILARANIHVLEAEFELSHQEILDLIDSAPRLKMAVRGWVAEQHLAQQLIKLPDVVRCERIPGDGQPDVLFQFSEGKPLRIECKNVLRNSTSGGLPRLDFMRSRESKTDPCGRFYSPDEFDVVAACLHPQVGTWSFRVRETREMAFHPKCPEKLDKNVVINDAWSPDLLHTLRNAALNH